MLKKTLFFLLINTLALMLQWLSVRPAQNLELTIPETAGDALIGRTPHGDYFVIDGGSDPFAMPQLISTRLPVWGHEIAFIALSAHEATRMQGLLALARRYHIRTALLPSKPETEADHALWQLLEEGGTKIVLAEEGTFFNIDGVTIRVLLRKEDDLALKLEAGPFQALWIPNEHQEWQKRLEQEQAELLFYPWRSNGDRALATAIKAQLLIYGEGGTDADFRPASFYQRGGMDRLILDEEMNGAITLSIQGKTITAKPTVWREDGAFGHRIAGRPLRFRTTLSER